MSTLVHIPGARDMRESLYKHPVTTYSYRPLGAIRKIAIHHSLTRSGSAKSFARYHVNHHGWPGIGYHFVIEKGGSLKWCNNLEVKSYHVGKSNELAIGICIVGDFQQEDLEEGQSSTLMKLLRFLLMELNLSAEDVLGHNEFEGYTNKSCPCIDMFAIREGLKPRIAGPGQQKFPLNRFMNLPESRFPFNFNEFSTRPGESVIAAAHRLNLFDLGDIKTRNRDLDLKKSQKEKVSVKVKGPAETVPKEIMKLIRTFKQKGYQLFKEDQKPYNLNIVGIRSDNLLPNSFDDEICVFWKFEGNWNLKLYKVTTDPGLTYLKDPINNAGTAILKEGQYRGVYKLGLHRRKYTALVQAAPVTVIRDFDLDDRLDFRSGVEQTGFFGINIHRASSTGESTLVNKWSAGCQVFSSIHHYNEFIRLCKNASSEWGDFLTYTLVRKSDLNHVS